MILGKKISVVIPCFNEEKGIAATILRIPRVVDEILVIDNLSQDKTALIAKKMGARVISEKKRGYGNALRTGMHNARGDVIVTADGDGTYPVEDSEVLVRHLIRHKLDFVSGSRFPLYDKSSMSITNVVGTKILNAAAVVLFGLFFQDILSGMWAFKKSSLNKLVLVSYDWNISEEIKIEAALKTKFSEVHIDHYFRLGQTKLLKWQVGFENLFFLVWKRLYPTKSLPQWLKLT